MSTRYDGRDCYMVVDMKQGTYSRKRLANKLRTEREGLRDARVNGFE
jgi:hypothetical protein